MLKSSLVGFMVILAVVHSIELDSRSENTFDLMSGKDHEKLLSRRRRYLVFPEGSSLQLVYDQIIGVVDYTNLNIFGITVALAWQLPNSTDYAEPNMSPTDAPNMETSPMTPTDGTNQTEKIDYFDHFDTYYNRKHYHSHRMDNNYYDYLKAKQTITRPPLSRKNGYDDWKKYSTNKIRWDYSHNVYPALRMRRQIASESKKSNGNKVHAEVKNFLKHHRDTRFNLYKSIEKYLDAKGENGEHCIKRAICETTAIEHMGKKEKNGEPESFVREIFRVIFSLPSAHVHIDDQAQPNKYDDVLNEIEHDNGFDCSRKYPECSTSFWNTNFSL